MPEPTTGPAPGSVRKVPAPLTVYGPPGGRASAASAGSCGWALGWSDFSEMSPAVDGGAVAGGWFAAAVAGWRPPFAAAASAARVSTVRNGSA